jgi:eukaryotic-like serine/threonine-protein kinase
MKLCPKCQKQFSDDANFCPVDAARLVPLEAQAVATDSISAKFQLGERLGGGRTGWVHRAIDRATGQAAVVKIIAPAVVALPGLSQRLERELKQLERVQSAGVAKVLASGKRADDSWVALELLDGAQTLAGAISARGPIALQEAAQLIEVVGEALIEAAQVGVVHRDLAPKNILFAGVEVKLINFSLPVPTTEKVPGVTEFVAPEQYDGKPLDQRSNLYSLGALYYFVLTGLSVQADANGSIKPPSALAPVPGPVDAMIMRALDRSPTKRFLTVRQFVDEVGRVARGEAQADAKLTRAMGRAGKPRAELVQTLLGVSGGGGLAAAISAASAASTGPAGPAISAAPGAGVPAGPSTVAGIVAPTGAAAVASAVAATVGVGPAVPPAQGGPAMPAPLHPHEISPERSPWAQPSLQDLQGHPALQRPAEAMTAPAVAAPVVTTPVTAPVTAPVVPAPVVSPPVLAAPTAGTAGDKKSSKPAEDAKGKFRETMWFKKGELDAQAAESAAQENAKSGKDAASDKADSLPIDERYKDDGSLSRSDKEKYSLRTGATTMTAALRDSGSSASVSNKVSEDALIGEMKGGRNRIFLFIAAGLVAVALIILLVAR